MTRDSRLCPCAAQRGARAPKKATSRGTRLLLALPTLILAVAAALAVAGPVQSAQTQNAQNRPASVQDAPIQNVSGQNTHVPPVPSALPGLAGAQTPQAVMAAFVGVPYRNDGAINEQGEFTLFADQGKRFDSPGLNCSGLVLGASRFLLGRNITLAQAMRDRLGDSGPGAAMGQDWDFGWDLILNISEGLERRFLLPGGAVADPAACSGREPLGWDVGAADLWRELPPRLAPGHLYLVSLTMQGRLAGYGLQHYHVGLILPDSRGGAWLYQTTGRGKAVNRRDLMSAAGRASFDQAFGKGSPKKMLVLEVALP